MGRTRKIQIEWSYPIKVDSALTKERCIQSFGIYYISRKFGNKETLLYIGLTLHQNFINRILQHHKNWMDDYRGEKYIRFGEFPIGKPVTRDMIEDIESCIIFELQPIHNINKKSSYTCKNEYEILNTRYRGVIPKEISTKNH